MTLSVHSPASLVDLAECCGSGSPLRWAAVRVQAEQGRSWALRDEAGEAVAAGGVLPSGGCWFIAAPAAQARMGGVVRAIRQILAGVMPAALLVEVRTTPGARLAALCGFRAREGMVWAREPGAHG